MVFILEPGRSFFPFPRWVPVFWTLNLSPILIRTRVDVLLDEVFSAGPRSTNGFDVVSWMTISIQEPELDNEDLHTLVNARFRTSVAPKANDRRAATDRICRGHPRPPGLRGCCGCSGHGRIIRTIPSYSRTESREDPSSFLGKAGIHKILADSSCPGALSCPSRFTDARFYPVPRPHPFSLAPSRQMVARVQWGRA